MFARRLLLATVWLCLCLVTRAQEISVEKVPGQARFIIESAAVTGLSGITWVEKDSFFAVADQPNLLVPITLQIDRKTGGITRGEFGAPQPIRVPVSDFEGVAYVSAAKTFYISAEFGSAVVRFRPGATPSYQPAPPIFGQARPNLGLESITWNDATGNFWIANEEALNVDGALSGATGTVVRMQRFDAQFQPLAQYAWRTEPAGFRFRNSGNGVADLCLLPDGRLLVLERGFALGGLQLRIFLADFTRATDISKLAALADAEFTPAQKTLLFAEATGFFNFEGLALGPVLDDGSRSLIAIADSNGSHTHVFLPLRLRANRPALSQDSGREAPTRRGAVRESQPR